MADDPSSQQSKALIRAGVHFFVPLAFYLFGVGHTLQALIAWFGATGAVWMAVWVSGMVHVRGIVRRDIETARTGAMPTGATEYRDGRAERLRKANSIGRTIGWLVLIGCLTAILYVLPWPITLGLVVVANGALLVSGYAMMRSLLATNEQFSAQMKLRSEAIKAKAAAPVEPVPQSPRLSEHPAFAH